MKITVTKADKWLIVCVLAGAVAGIVWEQFIPVSASQVAEIRVGGKFIQSVALKEGYYREVRLDTGEKYNIVEFRDSQVRMKAANCSDQDCVRVGWIRQPPRQIVCLPNQVIISLAAADSSDIDDIVR